MIIKQLNYDEYKGRQYKAEGRSDKYFSIEPEGEGFSIEWVVADKEIVEPLEDQKRIMTRRSLYERKGVFGNFTYC